MSELEDAIARFRSRLAVRESEAVRRIVADYHEVEQALREELLFILRDVDSVPPEARLGRLMRRDRLISLERQLVRELERITGRTYRNILKEQQHAARTASEDFLKLLDIATGGVADGIGFSFVRLNTEAVEHLVAALQDASPLQELMAELPQHAARRLRRELIHGVAVGRNPRETARAAAGALGGNMARALTISRTETLRAYRAATLEGYRRNSGVVRGWTWMSSLDRRTCPVCVAMHGTFHPLDEGFASHPACRCSAAPATRTWAELGIPGVPETAPTIESGADWFRRQSAATRERILGPAKFRAFQSRRLALEDLVGISESPRWGPGRFERSLASIVGSREAASLSSASRIASTSRRRSAPRPRAATGTPPPPRRPRARPAPAADDGDPLRDIHPSAAAMRRITNGRQIRSARWYMAQRAAARGMGLDEMESALEAHLRRLLRNARVNRRQHAWDLVTILDDGRFKTQFETGTSGGALNPTIRASREQSLFNLSRSTSPSLRPIYGYLTDGLADDNSYGPAFYGAVRVLFRQDVARRTTFVFTDSLSAIPAQAPSPLGQPRWYSHDLWGDPLELKSVNDVSPYAEAQIHGGVTIDAIEKVFLNSRTAENHPGLMAKLADHRIPWEFDDTLGVE